MASEKTPNLGLNQIDRTSPKTTYFDLEKYLDQNWRTVDDFAGDVNDGVNEIKKRLDTTERKAVTLEPGVQIVHAEKAAPFSLTGLSGRTLVNLLGRWGNLSSLTGVLPYQSDLVLDTLNKGTMLNSLKVTIKSGYTAGVGFYSNFKFLAGKYYVAIAKAKVGNATNAGISLPSVLAGTKVTDKTKFTTTWFRLAPTSDVTSNIDLVVEGTEGQYSYFEAVRIYEILASDYAALAAMTGEQIDAKYPYVDSVMPVRNPYAIRYGENLLPSVREWVNNGGLTDAGVVIKGEYEFSIKTTTVTQWRAAASVKVVPNTQYTLSATHDGLLGVYGVDQRVVIIGSVSAGSVTFNSGNNTALDISLANKTGIAGTFTGKDFMLNIGNTAKPFKPREDSMLALQTDLYADPVTGANADTVFERDGQYFKVKRFESVLLEGGKITAVNGIANKTGFKTIYPVIPGCNYNYGGNGRAAAKYNGKILLWGDHETNADRWAIDPISLNFAISITVTDSGWADSYTPTVDEIKAYFMGWRMRDQITTDPYTSGTKAWGSLMSGGTDYYTNTLPTTVAPDFKTPYQLVYQLATPTVEPIVSDGQLSFVEGDNQVEVGTGIVLRESAKPAKFSNYDINTGKTRGNATRYPVKSYLALYADSRIKLSGIGVFDGEDNGKALAIYPLGYEPSAAYSVTYLMLDKSPVASFVGSYAANEKTLLADLVDSVQKNMARVSVLENKKADKDNPAWITPTLLNGWTAYSTLQPVGYYKDALGIVRLRGMLKSGPNGSAVFRLPDGYKPSAMSEHVTVTKVTTGAVAIGNLEIAPTGIVIPYTGGNEWLSLDGITFLADR